MKSAFNKLMSGLNDVNSYLAGDAEGFRVQVPERVDVKEIRGHLGMTQTKFSNTFGFSLDAVKHWEGGRRIPDPAARAYLTIIRRRPEVVFDVLQPKQHANPKGATKKRTSGAKHGKPSVTPVKRAKRAHAVA